MLHAKGHLMYEHDHAAHLKETFLGESEAIPALKIWTVGCCDVEHA
jgi:hypothetical protein